MADIVDYLSWRGDLTFRQDPFNEVDNLLLSEFCFLDLSGIVPDIGEGEDVTLYQAAAAYFHRRAGQERRMGVLVSPRVLDLAEGMARSRRFGALRLSGYRACLDAEQETQFAALTTDLGDGTVYLAFRGTDDTLVGWKEDFNMAFLSTVPSQPMAAAYVKEAAAARPGRGLRLGGHSKGGNLAVYGAVHCPARVRRRVRQVYNNDGPGFKESLAASPAYQAVRDRIVTIVPRSSVVGMLLEHDTGYTVVDSGRQGLYQHDGFSWEVLGPRFVRLEEISAAGQESGRTIRDFIGGMDDSRREQFVDALFEVLGSTRAKTLTDIDSDWMGAVGAMLRSYKGLDKEERQLLGEAARVLVKVSAGDWVESMEERSRELRRLLGAKK